MEQRNGRISKILGLIIITFIIFNLVPVPTQHYVIEPGIAQELSPIITVEDGSKGPGRGDFMLTAVSSRRATFWDVIYIAFRRPKGVELESRAEHLPPGIDIEQYMEIMQKYMEDSKLKAQAVAFQKAGYPIEITKRGAKIDEVLKTGSAAEFLKKGDLIVSIDEEVVEDDAAAVRLIRKHQIGEEVSITVKRDEQRINYRLKTVELSNNPGKASIGVSIYTDISYKFPRRVSFHTENIAGSSAGTMFVLEIYNQLLPEDITKERRIAGTGTVDLEGTVGAIDGVGQKVISAESSNADLFLVPLDNYEEAKEYVTWLKLVPIETIDQALHYLANN